MQCPQCCAQVYSIYKVIPLVGSAKDTAVLLKKIMTKHLPAVLGVLGS